MTSLGRKKTESNCLPNFTRTISQASSYFVKVNTNGKLEARTKSILDKCSDLTCTKQYSLTDGPKRRGGGSYYGPLARPPPPPPHSHLMFATGLSSEKRPEQEQFSYPKFMYSIIFVDLYPASTGLSSTCVTTTWPDS